MPRVLEIAGRNMSLTRRLASQLRLLVHLTLAVTPLGCGMAQPGTDPGENGPSAPVTPAQDESPEFSLHCQENPADPITMAILKQLYGSKTAQLCARGQHALGGIESLDLRNQGVQSLESLQFLPGLHYLDIGENSIDDLSPLTKVPNLEKIWLDATDVSDLQPLAGMAKLRWLDISDTSVNSMKPISQLKQMQKLNISGTTLTDVHFLALLTNLRWLIARQAGLADVGSVSFLTFVRYLDLTDNEITDVSSLTNLPDLQELSLAGNPVAALPQAEGTCPTEGEMTLALRNFCSGLKD